MSDILYSKLRLEVPSALNGENAIITSSKGTSRTVQMISPITDIMLAGMEKYNVKAGITDEDVLFGYGQIKKSVIEYLPDIQSLPSTIDSVEGLFVYEKFLYIACAHYKNDDTYKFHCIKLTKNGWESIFEYTLPHSSAYSQDYKYYKDVCVTDGYIKVLFTRKRKLSSSSNLYCYPICVNFKIDTGEVIIRTLHNFAIDTYSKDDTAFFLFDSSDKAYVMLVYDNKSYYCYSDTLTEDTTYTIISSSGNKNTSKYFKYLGEKNVISGFPIEGSNSSISEGTLFRYTIDSYSQYAQYPSLFAEFCRKKTDYSSSTPKDYYYYFLSPFVKNNQIYVLGAKFSGSTYAEKYEIRTLSNNLIKTFYTDENFINPTYNYSSSDRSKLPYWNIQQSVIYKNNILWLNTSQEKILMLDEDWNYSKIPLYES